MDSPHLLRNAVSSVHVGARSGRNSAERLGKAGQCSDLKRNPRALNGSENPNL